MTDAVGPGTGRRIRPRVIAIDGPAAAGKGTLARRIAEYYGYAWLDSGRLYRAAAKRLLDAGGDAGDTAAAARAAGEVTAEDLDDPALANEAVAEAASEIAVHPRVREALLEFQRRFAAEPPGGRPGAVIDGRDIGTVVCPDADIKIFVTARLDVRAERRLKELREKGGDSIKARVLRDMRERDARDESRAQSPLKRAKDAHLLDTSGLDADQAFEAVRALIDGKRT